MPYLETVEELAEWIADKMGEYGTGPENDNHHDDCPCRMCFVLGMQNRIRMAVENSQFLSKSQIDLMRNDRFHGEKEDEDKLMQNLKWELEQGSKFLGDNRLQGEEEKLSNDAQGVNY